MKTPNTIERDINKIRLAIYEETKDMTPAQRAERVNKIGEAAAKKYGFKIVASASDNSQEEKKI
jgi:hypothetical protein